MFGVCTTLGLGTMQINEGLHLLHPGIPVGTRPQLVIIWAITSVATVSVLSGLQLSVKKYCQNLSVITLCAGVEYGIRRISEICFCSGVVLMLIALFLDQTVFLLNLYVQSLGFYLHNLLLLSFHSDAFEQLGPSWGSAGGGSPGPAGLHTSDGPADWMNSWTIFYWGWWTAWCPFVGMFIAKISRGRTVREFITGTMAAPVVYVFMWLVIFGGSGLRMEREAAGAGLCCPNLNLEQLSNLSLTSAGERNLSKFCDQDECNDCSLGLLGSIGNQSVEDWLEDATKLQVKYHLLPSVCPGPGLVGEDDL